MKRFQLSISFDDDKVVEGLIEPYKQTRLLTPLIVKLLTKYYYDEVFKKLTDDDIALPVVENKKELSAQEIADNIRKSFAEQEKSGVATSKSGVAEVLARYNLEINSFIKLLDSLNSALKVKDSSIKDVQILQLEDYFHTLWYTVVLSQELLF